MNIKSQVKRTIGAVANTGIVRSFSRRIFVDRTNVIYYHLVGEAGPHYAEFGECLVDRFEKELTKLQSVFTFEPLNVLCEPDAAAGRPHRKPRLAVTFDDGFRLTNPALMDVLEKFGVKATSFVITSCLDNKNLMWRNKLAAIRALVLESTCVARFNEMMNETGGATIGAGSQLMRTSMKWDMAEKDRLADELWNRCEMPRLEDYLAEHQPYFTWDELEEWKAAGHAVGLHTLTHPLCSGLSEEQIELEICEPARELRERLGLEFLPFSYPFGDRLADKSENRLIDEGIVDCAFGIAGFAKRGTPPQSLERVGPEYFGVGWSVFGRSILQLCLGR